MKKVKMTTSLFHAKLGVLNVGTTQVCDDVLADELVKTGKAKLLEVIKVETTEEKPKKKTARKKVEVDKNAN